MRDALNKITYQLEHSDIRDVPFSQILAEAPREGPGGPALTQCRNADVALAPEGHWKGQG